MPPIAVERFGPRNIRRHNGVKGAMRRLVGTLGVLAFFAIGAVGAVRLWNLAGSTYDAVTFPSHVAAGLSPHLKSSDAYRITLDYLNHASAEAEPGTVVAPSLVSIWAVTADQAAALDGCIPTGKGARIVWVTQGRGTYLNLEAHAWSAPTGPDPVACRYPGTAGTIVIDDATGQILGVYPYSGSANPHPSPLVTLAPAGSSLLPILPGSSSAQPSSSGGASGSPQGSGPPSPGTSPGPSASGR